MPVPTIIPIIQAQAASNQRLIFSAGAFTDELKAIPQDMPMVLFGMSPDMTDVLTRGVYLGMRWIGPHRCGVMEVDWVYSPMPPVPIKPVREFEEI